MISEREGYQVSKWEIDQGVCWNRVSVARDITRTAMWSQIGMYCAVTRNAQLPEHMLRCDGFGVCEDNLTWPEDILHFTF